MDSPSVDIDRNNFGPPDIQPHELKLHKKIGGGCFGAVYEGECRGMKVAIKKLFKQDLSPNSLSEFKREVELCSKLNHPNVLLFMGACTVPGEMAIVTELCDRGNLETLLHNKKAQLSLYRRILMAKETAAGMAWLHGADPQIIHRDIKPSNLLVDRHGQIKVCDFGLSAIKPANETLQDVETIPGTPLWMSPEVMMGRKLTEKADVYSYGIVLWEIVTQLVPFPDMTSFPKFRQAVCLNNVRPPLDSVKISSIRNLLERCWHKDQSQRPSFEEICIILDDVMIDCAIKTAEGRAFWKSELKGREFVPFDDFVSIFLKYTGIEQPDKVKLECLKMLLAKEFRDDIMKPIEVVKIEDFGKILDSFGPFSNSIPRTGKKDKLITIFDRVTQTCKQPWFHGNISTATAERLLSVHKVGYYLVRLSSSVSGCFTISRVVPNGDKFKIHHHRVDYKGDDTYISASTTQKGKTIRAEGVSLRSFIHLLKEDMNLLNACPGSKFRVLFKETVVCVLEEDGDGYGPHIDNPITFDG